MNRHERRAAQKKRADAFAKMVMQWPILPPGVYLRGRVVHRIVRHDDWCNVITKGGGMLDCNCNPIITNHLQPKDL